MNNKKRKIWIAAAAAVLVLAAALVTVLVWKREPEKPDYHQLIASAIEKTETQDTFVVRIYSTGTISSGDVSQSAVTSGYLYAEDGMELVSIYVNTSSFTENAQEPDYDVTVAMYCDGEGVYDNTGSTPVRMDMTCEEFMQIVSEYGLYHYELSDATEVTYTENQSEEYSGGQYSVTLSKPSEAVLESYAGILSDAVGESVKKEDLSVLSAYILYSVYDEQVVTQTCSFTVSCTTSDGRTVSYCGVNQVAYLGDMSELSAE